MKIKCLKCNNIIESLSQYDYRKCNCGSTSIGGGKAYTRIGGDLDKITVVKKDGTEVPVLNE